MWAKGADTRGLGSSHANRLTLHDKWSKKGDQVLTGPFGGPNWAFKKNNQSKTIALNYFYSMVRMLTQLTMRAELHWISQSGQILKKL
jgi:hypothetical protein